MQKRIAVFQYDWPIQSFSKDLAILLSEHKYLVDFYYFNDSSREMVKKEELNNFGISLIEYPTLGDKLFKKKNFISSVSNSFNWYKWLLFSRYFLKIRYDIIDKYMLYRTYFEMKRKTYDYAIGIEKKGLIWAGILCGKLKIPYIYYSLELYFEDHPGLAEFFHLLEPERYYHAKSQATIIQDEFRAEALFKANKVRNTPIYLPVSVLGKPGKLKSTYFQDKFNLSPEIIILLYFGGISANRQCEEIIIVGNELPEKYVTVFHGFGQKEYVQYLKSIASPGRVFFSEETVDENDIGIVISSADIGYALYSNDFANDRLIAFSSQKIALYCKFGIPFLGMNNETFKKLFSEFNCGEAIDNFNDIPEVIDKIIEKYADYSLACYSAFEKYSNLEKNFLLLNEYLQNYN